MTTTSTDDAELRQAQPGARGTREQRLVLAAGGVAVVAIAVILLFGYVPLPAFPSLLEAPDQAIPGEIAYLAEAEGDDEQCLRIVEASGASDRELRCYDGRQGDWPDRVAWTADGEVVVVLYGQFGPETHVLDAASGELLRTLRSEDPLGDPVEEPVPPDFRDGSLTSTRNADGARLVVDDGSDGRVTVTVVAADGARKVVLDVEGPFDYWLHDARWSPDGDWFRVTDSRDRLLIGDATADSGVRLLLADARGAAWFVGGVGGDTVDLDR